MPRIFVSDEVIEAQLFRSDTALRRIEDKAEAVRVALMERIQPASRERMNRDLPDSFLQIVVAPDDRTRDQTLFIIPDGKGNFSPFFLAKAEREGWVEAAIAEVFARGG